MAKSSGQKLKLIYLKDYLLRSSDAEHPVSINDMIAHLAARGISAERKSLYDDISELQLYGLDIERTKGKTTGYYVASREFQMPELKLLVDAVQSSRFITQKKTMALIKKIENLASVHEGRFLQRQVVVQNRVKSMNESVYYNVDILSEAIERRVMTTFKYFEYGPDKRRKFRHNDMLYQVSPQFLVWDDENYYLVALTDEGETRHYRVDKMSDILPTGVPADHGDIDPALYTNSLFGMYSGERCSVRLLFRNDMAGVAIDRFGKDVIFARYDDDHFTVNVDVTVSPQFFGWLFGLNGGAVILAPEDVRQQMKDYLEKTLQEY